MYHQTCPVEVAVDLHLAWMDDQFARDEAIEKRAQALLLADYAPFSETNLREALGEIDLDKVGKLLSAGQSAEAGGEIAEMVAAYWLEEARREAELQLDREIDHER